MSVFPGRIPLSSQVRMDDGFLQENRAKFWSEGPRSRPVISMRRNSIGPALSMVGLKPATSVALMKRAFSRFTAAKMI